MPTLLLERDDENPDEHKEAEKLALELEEKARKLGVSVDYYMYEFN